jgi:hypothetical protein
MFQTYCTICSMSSYFNQNFSNLKVCIDTAVMLTKDNFNGAWSEVMFSKSVKVSIKLERGLIFHCPDRNTLSNFE